MVVVEVEAGGDGGWVTEAVVNGFNLASWTRLLGVRFGLCRL